MDVLITTDNNQTIDDLDDGVGDTPETVFEEFKPPTVNIEDVITDDNGGIIEIPVDDPGDAWAEPPVVFVGGDSVSSQSKSHCFPDHKVELFLWCHRHRHASMSYVLVRRFIVRELHLIARKLLFSILDTHIRINLFII